MDKSIKKYGTDLQKEYDDINKKLSALEAKIEKRAKLLQKLSPDTIIHHVKLSEHILDKYKFGDLLGIIQFVEKEYIDKSEQLNMFKK